MTFRRFLASVLLFVASFSWVAAHEVSSVEFEFQGLEDQWRLTGQMDLAYMLPETRDLPGTTPLSREAVMKSTPAEFARMRLETEKLLRRMLVLRFNGKVVPWRIEFPDFNKEPFDLPRESGDWALMTTRIIAEPQPGPGELRAFWSAEEKAELIVTIEIGDDFQVLSASGGGDMLLLGVDAPPERFPILGWIVSGFNHVLPQGFDHMLFMLGLFLLAPKWKPLAGQSLLFTVAHSVTLFLAVLGVVSLNGKIVDVLIAASIAWVGIENLFVHTLGKKRLILVFCFGLLHGMGFASSMQAKLSQVPHDKLLMPVVGFNIGIELAQLAVLGGAFLFFLPLRPWSAKVQRVGSALVGAAGLYWMVERLM